MRTKLLPALMLGAVLLAGCSALGSGGKQEISGPPMDGCKVVDVVPEPNPTIEALIPAVSDSDHILGSEQAKVTIIEYSDFQCPYCAMLAPILVQLSEKYPDDLRVIFRHFPLNSHTNSLTAAYAAEAAGLQGKFDPMAEAIFAAQAEWGGLSGKELEDWFVNKAKSLGLDGEKLRADMKTDQAMNPVDESLALATKVGLPGTPFLFINGQPYQSSIDIDSLSAFVEFFKMEDKTYKACPPMIIDQAKSYTATLKTEVGDIEIKLYPDKAPLAVNSFVFLARQGWFNNVPFHRVLEGFVAQGGDPSGSGMGGPGYEFNNENASALFDREGLVAMANSGADTNGSQFFITYAPLENLNGGYTIFGEVTSNMDVVRKITLRDPDSNGAPAKATKILKVEIKEK